MIRWMLRKVIVFGGIGGAVWYVLNRSPSSRSSTTTTPSPTAAPWSSGTTAATSAPLASTFAAPTTVASADPVRSTAITDAGSGWVAPTAEGTCPTGYPIKANESSGIYHVQSGRSYARMVPERCYSTVEAAEADGFRPAKY